MCSRRVRRRRRSSILGTLARLAPIAIVTALLVATAIGFVLAERVKLERSPILEPRIDSVFSPVCECRQHQARVEFTLRNELRASVTVIDGDGDAVRTLAAQRRFPNRRVRLLWDGRDDARRRVPDGKYRLRLELGRRTIVPPNRIEVDTRAPEVTIAGLSRPVFSPDGDRRSDAVLLRYRIDERARAVLYIGTTRFERKKLRGEEGAFRWNGRRSGRTVPAGLYSLGVVARDDAGNLSAPARRRVRVRFIELARERLEATAGTRVGVRVRTDARSFEWRIGSRTGTAEPGVLVVRAPSTPGRYRLFVTANGHAARAVLVVRPRAPAAISRANP